MSQCITDNTLSEKKKRSNIIPVSKFSELKSNKCASTLLHFYLLYSIHITVHNIFILTESLIPEEITFQNFFCLLNLVNAFFRYRVMKVTNNFAVSFFSQNSQC